MTAEADKEIEQFNPRSLCIATATSYKDWYKGLVADAARDVSKIRGDLALEMFKAAKERGFNLVNVDGGSSEAFLEEVSSLGIVNLPETQKGMSPSRRQAFREASGLEGVKAICWTEPEKASVVTDCITSLVAPILSGNADIVVPRRSKKALSTYPDYQVDSERDLNVKWNMVLRKFGLLGEDQPDFDVAFGPKIFRNTPEVLSLFLARYELDPENETATSMADPETYSNATFFPIPAALNLKYKVEGVEVDYRHPKSQTRAEQDSPEFIRKRKKQRIDIVTSAIEFCRFLKGDPKSKIYEIK